MQKWLVLFVACFIMVPSLMAEEVFPLKLTIKTDKKVYREDEEIKLTYVLENISEEEIEIYEFIEPGIRWNISSENEKYFDVWLTAFDPSEIPWGDRIKLSPGQSTEEQEELLGRIWYVDARFYKRVNGIPLHPAKYIAYEGFLLTGKKKRVLLDSITKERKAFIWAQYCMPEQSVNNIDNKENAPTQCAFSEPLEIILDFKMPENGIVKGYYADGNIRSEREYAQGQLRSMKTYFSRYYYGKEKNEADRGAYGTRKYKDGKLNGEAKDFYENGQVEYVWNMVDGLVEGEVKWYLPDGELRGEALFRKNQLFGTVKEYLDNGTIGYSADFKVDKLHGKEIFIYPFHKNEISEKDDQDLSPRKYVFKYKSGRLEGMGKVLSLEGELLSETMYKDGKKDGISRTYFPGGEKIKKERVYKDDVLVRIKEYDQQGALISDEETPDQQEEKHEGKVKNGSL